MVSDVENWTFDPDLSQLQGRTDRFSWDEYYMALAILSSQRSPDPVTQVGACIAGPDNKVVSMGYNGMPRGCSDFKKTLPWEKKEGLNNKNLYVCHAELNAILNSSDLTRLQGSRMYVTLFPCNECAKAIIQTGIKEVIYLRDTKQDHLSNAAAKILFAAGDIKYRCFGARVNTNKLLKGLGLLEI